MPTRNVPSSTDTSSPSRTPSLSRGRFWWVRVILRGGRTTPGRIRTLTTVALLAVIGLFTVGTVAFTNARDGLQVIGHDAGPQVVATADIYFALSDMDAQVANILLMGKDHDLGIGHDAAVKRYNERRKQISQAILQAADLARDDQTQQDTIRSILDFLGKYQWLASEAMLLDSQSNHVAGKAPDPVVKLYRQANDLMKLELLPKAYNLTLDRGTIVRQTYEDSHNRVMSFRLWIGAVGVALIVVLLGLQVFLAVRFSRFLNPALALTTVATFALVLVSVLVLSSAGGSLNAAKKDGFDAVLSMSRARAISNTMHADEARSLLDPALADEYESVYQEKSGTVLYMEDAKNLDTYFDKMNGALDKYKANGDVTFLGFFGDETKRANTPVEKKALADTLTSYQRFQESDKTMRQLSAEKQWPEAIEQRMGDSIDAFNAYDKAVLQLIGLHRSAFESAVDKGDRTVQYWDYVLPVAAAAMILLILVGVRPRLREYR